MNYIILFLIFFLASCEQNRLDIGVLKIKESAQLLNALQNQTVTGGIGNVPQEAGDYNCKYSYVSQMNLSCEDLDSFSFNISNGNFSWSPNYQAQGSYHFMLTSPSGKKNKIIVEVKKMNVAPSVVIVTAPNSFVENSSYQFMFDASDLNGDVLRYSFECISNNCSKLKNVSLDQGTKTFSFETDYHSADSYSLLFRVSDGTSSDSVAANFNVVDVNRAPSLTTIGDQTLNEGELLSITALGLDADGNALTYSYSCSPSCPAGMSMTDNLFSWTPNFLQSGTYSVSFNVLDNGSPSLNDSETIIITVNNVNAPPSLALISNQTVDELNAIATIDANDGGDDVDVDGEAITYSCHYDTTVDGNVATSSLCTSLSGVTFNTSTGVMNWTPVFGSANHYEFKISGTDGNLSHSQIFTIKVNETYPMILTYRTNGGSEKISLPAKNGLTYNYSVDWGDGSALEKFTTDGIQTHWYTNPGDHVVKIYGQFPAIYFYAVPNAERIKLIAVNDLGKTGLLSLGFSFYDYNNLASFNVGNGETSNVDSTSYMFYAAYSITSLDLSKLNTSNVVYMDGMFQETFELASLNVENFDTKKVKSMSQMFYYAAKITELDLSSFDTSEVIYMDSMFGGASKLEALVLLSFDTSKVSSMRYMFYNTSSLTGLNLSSFNTENVTTMDSMFMGASSLMSLDLRSWVLSDPVPAFNSMFAATPGGKVIFCDQSTIGNAFGITCTP